MEEIPCIHDFTDPNTTIVVSVHDKQTWCISCGKRRGLMPLNDASQRAALAARDYLLFGGGSRGNN